MAAVKHARTLHQQHMAAGCTIGSARNAPENFLRTPNCISSNWGAQWQFIPTEWSAQSSRNALKQLLKNLSAQWSRGCTVCTTTRYMHN
jgi:hypothetical protein